MRPTFLPRPPPRRAPQATWTTTGWRLAGPVGRPVGRGNESNQQLLDGWYALLRLKGLPPSGARGQGLVAITHCGFVALPVLRPILCLLFRTVLRCLLCRALRPMPRPVLHRSCCLQDERSPTFSRHRSTTRSARKQLKRKLLLREVSIDGLPSYLRRNQHVGLRFTGIDAGVEPGR